MRTRKSKIVSEKLNVLLFVFLATCIWSMPVFAMDILGPAVAGHEQGWFDFGIEYSHTEMDIDLHNGSYTDYFEGVMYDWGDALDITIKDLEINRTYARFGYGLADNAEVFLRLGGLNAKFGDSIWEDSETFDSGTELAAGAGVKVTFFEQDALRLGGLFQFSAASFDGKLDASHWVTSDFVEVDMTEVQLALGASCKCNEYLTLYGGPFLHFVNGNISDTMYESSSDPLNLGTYKSEFDWDIKEGSSFGGYFGAQLDISEQCFFNIEYQQTADAQAFGMGLIFKY